MGIGSLWFGLVLGWLETKGVCMSQRSIEFCVGAGEAPPHPTPQAAQARLCPTCNRRCRLLNRLPSRPILTCGVSEINLGKRGL